MNKIKATDLKGFIAYEHQPYTDYSHDIDHWLSKNAVQVDFKDHTNRSCYIFTARDGEFYSHFHKMKFDKYCTNEEFKELIGMTKKTIAKEKLDNILNNEGQQVLDSLKEKYMNEMPKLVAGKHWVVVKNEGYGGIGLVVGDGMIYYVENEKGKPCQGFDIIEDVSQYIIEVREITNNNPPAFTSAEVVWKKVDQKQLAIQKELEFAKAKAERLAAHISVLESKLK